MNANGCEYGSGHEYSYHEMDKSDSEHLEQLRMSDDDRNELERRDVGYGIQQDCENGWFLQYGDRLHGLYSEGCDEVGGGLLW